MNYIRIARRKGLKDLFALFVAIITVLWMTPIGFINAAPITDYSLAMTDSDPAQTTVTYTLSFKVGTTATKIGKVLIKFCEEPGSSYDDATCTAPDATFAFTNSSSTIDGFGDDTANSITTATLASNILTVAVSSGGSAEQNTDPHILGLKNFTNPADADMYYARVKTTTAADAALDEGIAAFAVIEDVTITGTQPSGLTVTITGNTTVNDADCEATIDITSGVTATAVPFGAFKPVQESSTASQRVQVDTNSEAGYSVKATTDQLLTSGSNTIPGPTALSSNNWDEPNTYGFGICSDGPGSGTYTQIYENPTTTRTLYTFNDPVSAEYTYVYFQVAVQSTQEPGDYSATMNYLVTALY